MTADSKAGVVGGRRETVPWQPITIPLPPNSLRTNRKMGAHWAATLKDKKAYQRECALVGMVWRGHDRGHIAGYQSPNYWPVHLILRVYLGKGQRADAWDVPGWCKAGLDSLSGLLWPDDTSKYLNPVTVTVLRDPENPRIEIAWRNEEP